MIDIHAHLFWESYDIDRDAVVARAREAGIEQMICVGTSPEDNPKALAVAEKYDDMYASVGLHPHIFNNGEGSDQDFEFLREFALHLKVVAIGECGLDYYVRNGQPAVSSQQKTAQKEGFSKQMKIAEEFGLSLIIHTRPSFGTADAYEDLLHLLKDKSPQSKTVLHCYQGDTEVTKKFLELENIYFSFAGTITYPIKKIVAGTQNDSAETVKLVPLERLFVETDCPFLAPELHRGKRNEPAFVVATADRICELKNIGQEELSSALSANFAVVFLSQKP